MELPTISNAQSSESESRLGLLARERYSRQGALQGILQPLMQDTDLNEKIVVAIIAIWRTERLSSIFSKLMWDFISFVVSWMDTNMGSEDSAAYVNDADLEMKLLERKKLVERYEVAVGDYSRTVLAVAVKRQLVDDEECSKHLINDGKFKNPSNLMRQLIAQKAREYSSKFVSDAYAHLRHVDVSSVFVEPPFEKFTAYEAITGNPTHNMCDLKNYYLLGFVVYSRFKTVLKCNDSTRIAGKYKIFIEAFLDHAFYKRLLTDEEKGIRTEEMGSVVRFTEEAEKFNGFAYGRMPIFYFYKYLSFVYYSVMSPTVAIVYNNEEPHQQILKILLQSDIALGLFKLSCPDEIAVKDEVVMVLYRFIVKGR
jgi:hypothetical protein